MEQISRILLMLTSFASIVSTQSLVSPTEVRIPDDPGFYVQIAACCPLPIPINLYLPAVSPVTLGNIQLNFKGFCLDFSF